MFSYCSVKKKITDLKYKSRAMSKNRFYKVYIELTNICGLKCTFCPPKTKANKTLDLKEFNHILKEVSPYTRDIALHVVGDPLVVKNLSEYLNLALSHKLNVHITTTGYFLKKDFYPVLVHPAIKQVNFSLNSFNKNNLPISLEEYLYKIVEFAKYKNIHRRELFVNFRLWNLDKNKNEHTFNKNVFDILSKDFDFDLKKCNFKEPFRLDNKVLIHFDEYFEWPSLKSQNNTDGFCHGLSSQLAILAEGVVVPCCLDMDGNIDLGNIHNTPLKDILDSQKAKNIIDGFKNNKANDEFCKKCTYKHRFDK